MWGCMWKKCHSFAEQDYFTSMWNTFSVSSHSIVLHMVLRISLVLPVFLLHPTAKIWPDFSTSSPFLISRELRLSLTKLYIFYKLKNVQSIVDRRNWTRMHYFQTTWPSPSVVDFANSVKYSNTIIPLNILKYILVKIYYLCHSWFFSKFPRRK